jgi:hypothetical protein
MNILDDERFAQMSPIDPKTKIQSYLGKVKIYDENGRIYLYSYNLSESFLHGKVTNPLQDDKNLPKHYCWNIENYESLSYWRKS